MIMLMVVMVASALALAQAFATLIREAEFRRVEKSVDDIETVFESLGNYFKGECHTHAGSVSAPDYPTLLATNYMAGVVVNPYSLSYTLDWERPTTTISHGRILANGQTILSLHTTYPNSVSKGDIENVLASRHFEYTSVGQSFTIYAPLTAYVKQTSSSATLLSRTYVCE